MILLLILIYLTFIGLGLPDALLGASWPTMGPELRAPLSAAGILSMITSGGTVLSSLLSARMIHRFRTGAVTLVSVLLTALALLGYVVAPSFWWLCLLAIPLGIGAGSIDAALNNFVALHYSALHMNWLHCFWGVGATLSPLLMGAVLAGGGHWRQGYGLVALLLLAISLLLLLALPLWRKADRSLETGSGKSKALITNRQVLSIPGMPYALVAFLCYCGLESAVGLWAASFLVNIRGLDPTTAASWASLYFGGITAGRFLSGVVALKVPGPAMIRLSCALCLAGVVLLLLPLPLTVSFFALLLLGVGSAPFYPSMIHETPKRFGAEASQAAMGLQMASAYVGSTFMPLILGLLAGWLTLGLWPWFLLALVAGMFLLSERIPKKAE